MPILHFKFVIQQGHNGNICSCQGDTHKLFPALSLQNFIENLIQKRTGYSYRVLRTGTVILSWKANKDKVNQCIKFVFSNVTGADC